MGSSNLQIGGWKTIQDNIAGTNGTISVTDTNGVLQTRRCYRITIPNP